ncbi:bifunctional DNA primase/polymerase [Dactylosporangium sp. NPDC000521]|uniref:bifunctional DNA primase/polymerase n=1 Tax=Dactylosporangium sp. NPDC000521 TaxID=3363975 RepID=UPI0036A413FC
MTPPARHPHRPGEASPPPAGQPADPCVLVAAALRYAAAGIPVHPLHTPHLDGCSCREHSACASPGKHPRLEHGIHGASTAPALIRGWWRRWPTANIGVVTGTVLDVCDVDTNDGLHLVLDVLDVVRPAGPLVRTGLGWHLWFAASQLPSRIGFVPGVDWRGRGGSAVAPPSLHASGVRYRFQQPWNVGAALPGCPPTLRRLVLPPPPPPTVVVARAGDIADGIAGLDRYAAAAVDGEIARLRSAPRPLVRHGQRVSGGGRNNALVRAAFRLGQLAAAGLLDRAAVWPRLTDAALDIGLGPAETRRTIASGWRAGLRHPRRPSPQRRHHNR